FQIAVEAHFALDAVELVIELRDRLESLRVQLLRRNGQRRTCDDEMAVVLGAARILRETDARRRADPIRSLEVRGDGLKRRNDLGGRGRLRRLTQRRALRQRERREPLLAGN